jgi:hypothetical protein
MADQPVASIENVIKIVQSLGFPIIVCTAVLWFANDTIEWERQTMVSVITANTEVMKEVHEGHQEIVKMLADYKADKADQQ